MNWNDSFLKSIRLSHIYQTTVLQRSGSLSNPNKKAIRRGALLDKDIVEL